MKTIALFSIGSFFVAGAAVASPAPAPVPAPAPAPVPAPQQPIQAPQSPQQVASYSNSSTDLSNNGTVEQSNSLQQAQYGSTMSNVQVNNNNDAFYGFGQGIAAPVPTINVSTYGGTDFNGYGNFGGIVTLSIPLGGKVSKTHRRYTTAIADATEENLKQKKLQTEMERTERCAKLAQMGVQIARLTFCQDIEMIAQAPPVPPAPPETIMPPAPPAPPAWEPPPKVPVPGLW
jgi:hypothetical protein